MTYEEFEAEAHLLGFLAANSKKNPKIVRIWHDYGQLIPKNFSDRGMVFTGTIDETLQFMLDNRQV